MPKYRIQVADKETGDEHVFDVQASSEDAAKKDALEGGWLIMSCNQLPESENKRSRDGIWTPADPTERAVVRGVVKAYVVLLVAHIVIALAGLLILGIINATG